MTNEEIYELVLPLLQTEFKYRDYVEFATDYDFDPSFKAYENFCKFVDDQINT